ncbi:MAG: class F sortase [Candidatus Viridilinea halotolerans]|uniref:Class F sortase n=1 Tax=Candidatus Viridilinea halotolerans TaxID=2491704 RepID=A0A426TTP7_9CHLR|nr:MAG: class F sortase [Candidatus Viridilinea halotolerans]
MRLLILLSFLLLGGCGVATSPQGQPTTMVASGATATALPIPATALPIPAASLALLDQPLLEPQPGVAEVQPTLVPTPDAPAGRPVRLVIEMLGLDREVLAAGLDAQNMPLVPDHDVAWYSYSATPGQGENIVLWGHVMRFRSAPDIPAPFARLHELAPGAQIALYDAQGRRTGYRVTHQIQALPHQIEYMLPKGHERLTLITCIGEMVVDERGVNMSHRLITLAEPE